MTVAVFTWAASCATATPLACRVARTTGLCTRSPSIVRGATSARSSASAIASRTPKHMPRCSARSILIWSYFATQSIRPWVGRVNKGPLATTMAPFTQRDSACRCEWGPAAAAALAPADVTIVIDVFSFTTCVDVATSRGAAILPYLWKDASAEDFARAQGAELAGKRRQSKYSLDPESFLDVAKGFRCVLPSPNGAQVTLAA